MLTQAEFARRVGVSRQAINRAVRDLLFHDLRRSAARTMRRVGVDELTIMARGGWKTRAMFARYAITDERDQVEAQAKLDRALALSAPRTVVALRRQRKG